MLELLYYRTPLRECFCFGRLSKSTDTTHNHDLNANTALRVYTMCSWNKTIFASLAFSWRAMKSLRSRKLEIEVTLSATFFTKTPRYGCFLVYLVIYMNFKWISLSIFPWTQSNFNGEKERLYFNDFFWQVMFKIFEMLMKHKTLEWIPSPFPYFD